MSDFHQIHSTNLFCVSRCWALGLWRKEWDTVPALKLLTFLMTQCGKYGGKEVYIPHVKGAQKHRELTLSECVSKAFTEMVIIDKLWLSRSSNGRLVCTGTSGKVKMFQEAEIEYQKAKRNKRPWGLRKSPGDQCVRNMPSQSLQSRV